VSTSPTQRPSLPPGIWRLALGPLDDPNRPAAVAQRLRQAISIGVIPPGIALPPESELAVQMNVSVGTLRSSLALLREQGLIETRRGRHGGNFVSAVQEPSEQRLTRDLLKTNIDGLRDRRDFYTAIGGKAAELAASRARGHVLDRLQEAAAAVAEAPDSPSAVRLDSRFHLELAASTRSVMLTKAELAAQNDVTPLLWIPGSECLEAASCAREHMAIVEAVAAGDPLLARRQAENHLADSLNQLIELRMRLQQQAATEPRRRGSRTSEGQR